MSAEIRVVEKITLTDKQLKEIITSLKLTSESGEIVPKEGRIASNLIVKTKEKGNIVIRAYPKRMPEKLETGNVNFEIEVLTFLSDKNMGAPQPMLFKNGKMFLELNDLIIFVYPFIPGSTVAKEQLTKLVAEKAGSYMSNMVQHSIKFVPNSKQNAPKGDLEYINEIYKKRLQQYPELQQNKALQSMQAFISNSIFAERLAKTPEGFVHADFFFENLVLDDNSKASIIDFGDCYYGHVVMDIAIGAMEFSAVSEDKWDFEMLEAFLKPNFNFLMKNNITAEFLVDIMKANCLRFAIYTVPFTLNETTSVDTNGYITRFNYLQKKEVLEKFKEIFSRLSKENNNNNNSSKNTESKESDEQSRSKQTTYLNSQVEHKRQELGQQGAVNTSSTQSSDQIDIRGSITKTY